MSSSKKVCFKMFANCIRLRGQNGTIYDGEHIDKEYARIDKEGIPGYLSDSTQEFNF